MTKNIRRVVSVIGLTLLAVPAVAQDRAPGFYFQTDVGVSIPDKVEFASGDFDTGGGGGEEKSATGVDLSLNTGLRFDLIAGYEWRPGGGPSGVALELNTGVLYNTFEKLNAFGVSTNADGALYQIPVMANLVYNYHLKGGLTPFLGGGGGGVLSIADVSNIAGQRVGDSGSEFVGAYQFFAGVRYAFAEHAIIGVAYKYLGTSGATWEIAGSKVHGRDLVTHSVTLTLTYKL